MSDPTPKPVLLYLPGLDGSGRLLFTQTRLFKEYDVLCQVYPNDKAHDYESLATDAAQRLQAEYPGRKATLLAESFGGGVSIEFVTRFPQLVERWVLVNTFARFPKPWLPRLGSILRFGPSRPSPVWTRRFRERTLFADDMPRESRDQWWEQVKDLKTSTAGHRARLISGLDRLADLASITIETLVIVATDDRLVAPSAGYELAKRIPNAKLVEVTGGHTLMAHPSFDLCDHLGNEDAGGLSTAAGALHPSE
ncbi:MAG: alpha/beta fold hydrolase [Planctomycetota bacterium]